LYLIAKEKANFDKDKTDLQLDFYTNHQSAGDLYSMASKYGGIGDFNTQLVFGG
jgi:hypothetical protein